MKLKSLLSTALNVVGAVVPQVGQAVGLVNQFLPEEKRLGATATGQDVVDAYDSLPPETQAEIDRRAEVEIAEITASVDKLQAMVSVESAGANTRPEIALLMARLIVATTVGMVILLFTAVLMSNTEMLQAVSGLWPIIGAMLSVPATVVLAYFGKRSKDKAMRYQAATGQPVAGGVGALIQGLLRR